MADVFISYAHDDRSRIVPLADALAEHGFSVWWDREIHAGSEFSDEIERELTIATHVIVCWSERANRSNWVRDEATIAARAGKLKAISLDGREPPMGFMQLHALDFSQWRDSGSDDTSAALVQTLKGGSARHSKRVAAPKSGSKSKTWMAGALLLLLSAAGAGWFVSRDGETQPQGQTAQPAPAEKTYRSIAVLAFADLSPDGDRDYFSDGLASEVLYLLARETDLHVVSRTSSFFYKGKDTPLSEIAKALNVDTVLEGSVRKAGNRVRIDTQLVDAASGESLWGVQFDRELADIFAIQDEVAQEVTRALASGGDVPAIQSPTTDPETYDLYLRAQYQFAQRGKGIATAEKLAAQVTERDATFAPGWALLAMTKMFQYSRSLGLTKGEFALAAKPHIDLALELAPKLAEAFVARGYLQGMQGNQLKSIAAYRQALDLNPNVADARHLLYIELLNSGAWQESFQVIDQAYILDPLSPSVSSNYVFSLMRRGRGEEALAAAERASSRFPDYTHFSSVLGSALRFQGRLAEAARIQVDLWEATQNPRYQVQSAIYLSDLKLLDFPLPEMAPISGQAFQTLLGGDKQAAAEKLLAALEADPSFAKWDAWAGELLWWSGQEAAALEFFLNAYTAELDNFFSQGNDCNYSLAAAALFRRAGEIQKAEALLSECETIHEIRRTQGVGGIEDPDEYAELLVLKGDHEGAIRELEQVFEGGFLFDWWFHLNPIYDPIRDDPAFTAVVESLNEQADREREKYLSMWLTPCIGTETTCLKKTVFKQTAHLRPAHA